MKCKLLFICLSFIFLSFDLNAFDPGHGSQFIGYFKKENLKGNDSLTLEDPKNSIILLGSLVETYWVTKGDEVKINIEGMESISVNFI